MNDVNPYAPPAHSGSYSPPSLTPETYEPASQNARFVNFVIDSIVATACSYCAGSAIVACYMWQRMSPAMLITPEEESFLNGMNIMVGFAAKIAYFVVMEGLFQRTFGKFASGTKVIGRDGQRPSWAQILGRSCARFIPFEPFSLLSDSHPVGWHDSLSRTMVVSTYGTLRKE
jgi:uncharacterized RDD family membrane protein YckC